MIKLSIIIVNYNTSKLTLAAIASVIKNKPKVSYEIIIIDNASKEKLEKSLKYKLIENKKNLGFATAVNQGIKKAKGEYIFLFNSDALVGKGALDKLVEFAENTPDAGAVVPKLINPDGTLQASIFRLPTAWLALSPTKLEKFTPSRKQSVKAAVMAAFLITPKALETIGLLDEKYFLYFEDLDYARKLKKAGLKIYYIPSAKVVHEHGASGGVSRQLIASSKKYHGWLGYYIYTFILWMGQKWSKLLKEK